MHHFGRKKGKGSIIFLVTFMFWNIGEKHDFLLKSTWQEKSNLQSMYIVAGLESLLLYLREEKEAKSKSRAWWKSNVRKIQLLYMGEAFQRRISNPYSYPYPLQHSYHKTFLSRNCCQGEKQSFAKMSSNKSTLLKVLTLWYDSLRLLLQARRTFEAIGDWTRGCWDHCWVWRSTDWVMRWLSSWEFDG